MKCLLKIKYWSNLKDNLQEKLEKWYNEYKPLTNINLIIQN